MFRFQGDENETNETTPLLSMDRRQNLSGFSNRASLSPGRRESLSPGRSPWDDAVRATTSQGRILSKDSMTSIPSQSVRGSAYGRKHTMKLLSNLQDYEFVRGEHKKLDAKQVNEVAEQFCSIVQESNAAKLSCKQMFAKIFTFKKRPIQSATLLHFAIWFTAHAQEDTKMFETILYGLEDPDDVHLPAAYLSGNKTIYVSAIHIAAGLGQTAILKLLAPFVGSKTSHDMQMSKEQYVNQWALATASPTNTEEYLRAVRHLATHSSGGTPFMEFYQCIHESTFAGYSNVSLWLLEKRADPGRENLHGITPLHFVAFCGISGCMDAAESEQLHKLVRELQRTGKGLTKRADMSSFITNATDVTPLEVAVNDASRFPQCHLSLLAPCLSDKAGVERTFFDDIKMIADVSAESALKLVRAIADLGKYHADVLKRFYMEAQLGGKSDMLASIFYIAPLAAAEILEILEIEPEVEDPSHYSIPATTSLRGVLQNVPMRCTYQADSIQKEQLTVPCWEWKNPHDPEFEYSWHHQLVPRPPRKIRASSVKPVKVVACALPDLLDIDIFMALAQLDREDYQGVLSKKMVQGAIFCLWSNLLETNWMKDLAFSCIDLGAWVVMAVFADAIQGTRLQVLCWMFVAASVLRATWWVLAFGYGYLRKYQLHHEMDADPTLAEMWSGTSPWFWSQILPNIAQAAIGLMFVMDVSLLKAHGIGGRTEFDDALLAILVIMATVRVASLWQLSAFGTRIFAIQQTIMSAAVNQMLFITFLCLACFVVVLVVLSRHQNVATAINTYRGFLFGDGDGFSGLGMHENARASLLVAIVFGSFAFNIVVLNIIIAIYGNEYDRAEKHTSWLFMMGRVQYCVTNVIGSYLIPWSGQAANRAYKIVALTLMLASVCVGVHFRSQGLFWLAAVLLACGQNLWSMALIQCEWFSPEGVDSEGKTRFLWVCHARDWLNHYNPPEEIEEMQAEEARQLAVEVRFECIDGKVNSVEAKLDHLLHLAEFGGQQPMMGRNSRSLG